MVSLRLIDDTNRDAVEALSIAPEQRRFVSGVRASILEAQQEPGAHAAFWTTLTGTIPPGGALKVSVFSYDGAPMASLVEACAKQGVPVWIIAPEGIASSPARRL